MRQSLTGSAVFSQARDRPSDRLGARGRPSGRRRFRMMIL
jgi:hypothetical protein